MEEYLPPHASSLPQPSAASCHELGISMSHVTMPRRPSLAPSRHYRESSEPPLTARRITVVGAPPVVTSPKAIAAAKYDSTTAANTSGKRAQRMGSVGAVVSLCRGASRNGAAARGDGAAGASDGAARGGDCAAAADASAGDTDDDAAEDSGRHPASGARPAAMMQRCMYGWWSR